MASRSSGLVAEAFLRGSRGQGGTRALGIGAEGVHDLGAPHAVHSLELPLALALLLCDHCGLHLRLGRHGLCGQLVVGSAEGGCEFSQAATQLLGLLVSRPTATTATKW